MAVITVLSGVVAGCAAQPDWTRPGTAAAQTETDWQACRDLAEQQAGYSGDSDSSGALADYDRRKAAQRQRTVMDACMRGQGYFPRR